MDTLEPLIIESVQLMLIGMSTVFIILVMLIFLINMVSSILPEEAELAPVAARNTKPTANNSTSIKDDELVAVIGAAISSFKKRHF